MKYYLNIISENENENIANMKSKKIDFINTHIPEKMARRKHKKITQSCAKCFEKN